MFLEILHKYIDIIWPVLTAIGGCKLIWFILTRIGGRLADKLADALAVWIIQVKENKTAAAAPPEEHVQQKTVAGKPHLPHPVIKWGIAAVAILTLVTIVSRLYLWGDAGNTTSKSVYLVFEKDNSPFPLSSLLPDTGQQATALPLDSAMQARLPAKWPTYKGPVTVHVPERNTLNLELPDGTLAYLDDSTSLGFSMPFGSGNRELMLKGQAYIQTSPYQGQGLKVRSGQHPHYNNPGNF